MGYCDPAENKQEGSELRNEEPIRERGENSWPVERPSSSPQRDLTDEFGAGLAEYALLLLLIALACIGALTALAPSISGIYNQVSGLL